MGGNFIVYVGYLYESCRKYIRIILNISLTLLESIQISQTSKLVRFSKPKAFLVPPLPCSSSCPTSPLPYMNDVIDGVSH